MSGLNLPTVYFDYLKTFNYDIFFVYFLLLRHGRQADKLPDREWRPSPKTVCNSSSATNALLSYKKTRKEGISMERRNKYSPYEIRLTQG